MMQSPTRVLYSFIILVHAEAWRNQHLDHPVPKQVSLMIRECLFVGNHHLHIGFFPTAITHNLEGYLQMKIVEAG